MVWIVSLSFLQLLDGTFGSIVPWGLWFGLFHIPISLLCLPMALAHHLLPFTIHNHHVWNLECLLGQTQVIVSHMHPLSVGSTQVPFLMCTLEIPQKIAAQVLALNFVIWLIFLASLSTMSLSFLFLLLLSILWIFQSYKLNILELLSFLNSLHPYYYFLNI